MWTPAMISVASIRMCLAQAANPVMPSMDVVAVFGFLTASLTLVVWKHRDEYRWCGVALSACLCGLAVYAFLEAIWPLGMLEGIWSAINLRKWYRSRKFNRLRLKRKVWDESGKRWKPESRMRRLFGE